MDEQTNEKKEKLLKQIDLQKNFMIYLQYLLEKTQKNRRKDRVYENKKTGRKYFIMPTLLERFFDIEFTKYIILKDRYFLEYGDESIDEYINTKREFPMPTKQVSGRVGRHAFNNYLIYYFLFYYFKTKYNIKITDSFLYLIYIATNIPPAVLAYMQLHSDVWFKRYRKMDINWENFFAEHDELKKAVEMVEERYLRGLKSGKQNSVG